MVRNGSSFINSTIFSILPQGKLKGWCRVSDIYTRGLAVASKQNEFESLVPEGKSTIGWDGICFNKYFQSVYLFQGSRIGIWK